MVNQDEEGIAYTNHSGDEQHRNQQPEHQQEELDLNAMTNDDTEVDVANVDSGGIQNGQLHPQTTNPNGKRIPSTIGAETPHAIDGTRGPRIAERECETPNRYATSETSIANPNEEEKESQKEKRADAVCPRHTAAAVAPLRWLEEKVNSDCAAEWSKTRRRTNVCLVPIAPPRAPDGTTAR
ncbi:hypothetical protein PIB30_103655 [Stylosanthes scabra]|uniref:Uncharacterized protein n=1 Tax=Stylosanthes scabra TaxID=79078 RepID=A0ABU6T0F5_9FABA|nr:hypothetical protein [Stylosanthes scabra]